MYNLRLIPREIQIRKYLKNDVEYIKDILVFKKTGD
jgi:hypothetical protein